MTVTDAESTDHPYLPVSTLTPTDVSEYLRDAVRRYGDDYCDPEATSGGGCNNVYRNEDSGEVTARCIAAEVLSQWGVPDSYLEKNNADPIAHTIDLLSLPVHPTARVMLGAAQSAQDGGASWRVAQMVAARVKDELRNTGLIDRG